jgi:arabinan endo-1,5-alpha-L-arabinosidase
MYRYLIIFLLFQITWEANAQSNQNFTPPSYPDDYSSVAGLNHIKEWASYNAHDPSCIKADDGYYYLYSTDAIYIPRGIKIQKPSMKIGNIMVRRSRDLVHWKFLGWAFSHIPVDAVKFVTNASDGRKPMGIWAPYIEKYKDKYRLYYAVSIFGENTSYIGLAESNSPLGPWSQKGCVVKTTKADTMNAIDPTVSTNKKTGQQWMIYGSFFGGIYALALNSATGLSKTPNDYGHCVARRAGGDSAVIEAPEVIYNPEFKKYYLFVSYDPLFTTYNVRVGRGEKPEGPYYDLNGNNLILPIDHTPVLTYAYRFSGHPGWAGVGHCGVLNDHGNYFMFHQGRLAPTNLMMDLHVRRIFWTPDGWPVVSPERYAAVPQTVISENEIIGTWETIQLKELDNKVKLWKGQIPGGYWKYDTTRFDNSKRMIFLQDGRIKDKSFLHWSLNKNLLTLYNSKTQIAYVLIVSRGWDWERKKLTIVFTGLGKDGYSFWGKKLY